MLALLASVCFPLGAQAETVYESEKTEIPGTHKPNAHNPVNNPSEESSAKAHSSSNPPAGENGSESGESSNKSTSPGVAGDGSDNRQGSQDSGSQPGSDSGGKQAVGNVGESQSVGDLASANTPAASDDGGSSPLIPILIAIAVLAAISVGVVFVRQRRQDGGTGPGDLTRKAS